MSGEVNNLTANFTDLTTEEKWVLYPVVVLILLIGIYPAPILELSEPAVTNLLKVYSNFSASVK
jgi:NADH-quinone oxidoreductase subunit M